MRWITHRCGTIHDLSLSVSWDHKRLGDEVDRRVGGLIDLGVQPGAAVAIVHGNSAPFIADLLAIWACGAVAILLDPALAKTEMDTLVQFLNPSLVLADRLEPGLMPGVAICRLGDAGPLRPDYARGDVTDLALVLVTSGTTGMPKAVALSHQALHNRLHHNLREIGEGALARTLVTLPSFFGHGLIGNVLTPLFAGGDVVFSPRGTTFAGDLARLIDAHRITFLTAVPALWRMALKMSREPANGTLRRVHIGSAPLSEQLWRNIMAWSGAETVNCYGLTEVANWFSGASSRSVEPRNGLVGRPWGGKAAVWTSTGTIAASGEGELLIQSPSMMDGYLHRPDLTRDCQVDGWYRTGDLGLIEDDGLIVLQGRLKDEINRGGTKIQPAELDLLIESHPAVEEACTFSVPDPITGETVAAAVCLKPGMRATSESLTLWCRERIRRVAVPEKWYFVSELPRSSRGKTRRDQVYRMLFDERT